KTFPEQPLTFVVEENNTVEISSNHGKYALAYANGEEFPNAVSLDNPSTTTVEGDILANAISKTIVAAGNDDLRPVKSVVFFQFSPSSFHGGASRAHKLVRSARADVTPPQPGAVIMADVLLNLCKGIPAGSQGAGTIEYNGSTDCLKFNIIVLIC